MKEGGRRKICNARVKGKRAYIGQIACEKGGRKRG